MDANGLRFWMLANQADWKTGEGAIYDASTRRLRLQSRRDTARLAASGATGVADKPTATKRLNLVPGARDQFATRAEWQASKRLVMATGAVPGAIPIYAPPAGENVTDLALGNDDVLYLAVGGRIVQIDRRNRWSEQTLSAPGFAAWRLAVHPNGGVWVLDRDNGQIGIVQGLPLPERPFGEYAPDTFRPCEENPNPPRLVVLAKAVWPGDETPVAIAASLQGRLVLLTWQTDGTARLRYLDASGWTHPTFGPPTDLRDADFAYSLTWLDETKIAVRTVALPGEALVYPIGNGDAAISNEAASAAPVGDFYPLRNAGDGPFLHGLEGPPHYPTVGADGIETGSMPLFPLSLPSYAQSGQAANDPLQAVFDSGEGQTTWHRLYLEAIFPARCSATIWLAATQIPVPPNPNNADAWHVHRFGDAHDAAGTNGALTLNGATPPRTPQGAWVSSASELPFHPGFLPCPRESERIGLFTVLVQRAGRRVQTLRGRYLWLRVELSGDGRATPEIAALRAYGSRFSYVEHYLPELYHETVFGPDADDKINGLDVPSSTPTDFLERFVDNFEGIFTPLEDKIAASYLLTDAHTAPEDALEWLGSWIGMSFDPGCPAPTRRKMLAAAPELYRKRGTLRGLARALDIATNEAVTRGQVVLLEDFRLRRTFATILGADLAEDNDPLLAGPTSSGNSYVGDTLILGDENKREFLALFNADLPETQAERKAIQDWYDKLAYRLTILVHAGATPDDWARIRRIVALETPAHVAARILPASNALLIGASSLVGVDTYLSPKPKPQTATLDWSQIGSDVVRHLPGLDPRLEADPDFRLPAALDRPFADAGPGQIVGVGDPITLNAGRSHAAPGATLTDFIWTLVKSDSPPKGPPE